MISQLYVKNSNQNNVDLKQAFAEFHFLSCKERLINAITKVVMAARSQSVTILRNLYRELRPTVNAPQKHVYQTQLWKYIVGLCRDCRNFAPGEVALVKKNLESTGRSYLFYLQAAREYHRISDEYKGAGERTAEDTAKMLGFKMPNEPKESKPVKSPVEGVSSHSVEFSSEHTNISKNARDSRIV